MSKQALIIFFVILLGALALILGAHLLDYAGQNLFDKGIPLFFLFLTIEPHVVVNYVGSLAEVTTALFGIIITVVAIIVNLSANRYTSKVIDLFIKDRFNVVILAFFAMISFYSIWITNAVQHYEPPVLFSPTFQILLYLFLVSLGVLLIVPYFYFVFHFLTPKTIISKIKNQAQGYIKKAHSCKYKPKKYNDRNLKDALVGNIEQLSEICKGSLISADRSLGLHSLKTLNQILDYYLDQKDECLKREKDFPFSSEWYYDIDWLFLGLNQSIVKNIKAHNYWFEYRLCQEYESILSHSIDVDSKITYQTAVNLTEIGSRAMKNQDVDLIQMVIRYFNTFLKISVTKKTEQTTIDVFYQYYRLLSNMIYQSASDIPLYGSNEYIIKIAGYFKYYGQMASLYHNDKVLEFTSYFLRRINVLAYRKLFRVHKDIVMKLLNLFLTVDDFPEKEDYSEKALIGVRQSQAILAAFYLQNNEPELELKIIDDMKNESRKRMKYIKKSILDVTDETFFEIDNIGINTVFIRKDRAEKLEEFFQHLSGGTHESG